MAKKRDVKKDIAYLTYEIIADSFAALELYPDRKPEEILSIIDVAVKNSNDLMDRVNQKNIEKGKEVKKHFQEIYKDLIKGADEQFSKLSEIIKDK